MGDPRKQRKKYKTPSHPWEAERIEQERELKKEYGLKNKKEIWKFHTKQKDTTIQARNIIASKTKQAKKEEKQLIDKLYKQGIIEKNAKLDDVLNLNIKNFLDRRLQTIVFKKGLARTIRQARQFIKHHHILVNNKLIDAPSYIVLRDEEDKLIFNQKSSLSNKEHPERIEKTKKIEKELINIEEQAKELITDEEKFKENESKAQELIKKMQDNAIEDG